MYARTRCSCVCRSKESIVPSSRCVTAYHRADVALRGKTKVKLSGHVAESTQSRMSKGEPHTSGASSRGCAAWQYWKLASYQNSAGTATPPALISISSRSMFAASENNWP